jgi:ferritin-like metal-binding protein YciE
MQKINDLQELLKHELKDLYSAEVQLIDALPKMAEKATNPNLKKAFTAHLKVTREQQKRLEKIQSFLNMEKTSQSKGFWANLFSSDEGEQHCKAMEGLVKEAESLMDEDMTPEVMDAALIAAAQKAEHYEISSYGTARAYATQLGFKKVYDLLSATLQEEYFADDSLTLLAVGKVNKDAEEGENETPVASKSPAKKTKSQSSAKPAPKKTLVKNVPKQAPAKKAAAKKKTRKANA